MIDTEIYSARLRAKAVRTQEEELLVSSFSGSGQEADLTEPPNCGGVGRIRHFRRITSPGWPENPLPIDPAAAFLGMPRTDMLRAQAFQNAACNWRCWYCYVPFSMLGASKGVWVTADDLVEGFRSLPDRPSMIDLTGGQPDLVPEWVPWMIGALRRASLDGCVYLWSDDNLSNDYFWRYLDEADRRAVADHPGYGRVCCFKGFDARSFSFNTKAVNGHLKVPSFGQLKVPTR